jgi:hypothetical protein
MYMPPPTQNLFFGSTPSVQQAAQFTKPELRPIPALKVDVAAQTEAVAPPMIREMGVSRGVDAAPARAEMEVQTEDIMLPMRGGEKSLAEIETELVKGEKTLSLRPSKYSPRGRREEAAERTLAAVGGGAAGGGPAPSGPDVVRSLQVARREGGGPAPTIGEVRELLGAMRGEEGAAAGGGGARRPRYVLDRSEPPTALGGGVVPEGEEERESRVREALSAMKKK